MTGIIGVSYRYISMIIVENLISNPDMTGIFYDKRELMLSHNSKKDIIFTVEVDPTGNGDWMEYTTFSVKPDESLKHQFSGDFEARWIRFKTNSDTKATSILIFN